MPGLTGSIPRSIFEAEPTSGLNTMYNAEWEYATDQQGRAYVNSDPAHWPLILIWLSFSSIPAQPSDEIIAECSYWQLDSLLAKMEEQRMAMLEDVVTFRTHERTLTITHVLELGRHGFLLKGLIHNFRERYNPGKALETDFAVFGMSWRLRILPIGVYLQLMDGPAVNHATLELSFGDHQLWKLGPITWDSSKDETGWGFNWPADDKAERVQRPPNVGLNGSLHVTLKLLFKREL